jgi:PAS domain S-box-containing protein
LWDLDVGTGRIVVGPEYARLLGLPPQSFVETDAGFYARMHPDDVAPVQRAIRDYLTGDSSGEFRAEFRQRHGSGHWVWLLSVGRRVDAAGSGRPERVLGTITDITRRRDAEATLRTLARELERLVAERTGQLAASEQRYRNIFELVPMAIVEENWSEAIALLQPHRAAAAPAPQAWLRSHPEMVAACLQAVRVVRLNPAAAALYGLAGVAPAPQVLKELFTAYDSGESFIEELASLLAGKRRHDQMRGLRRTSGEVRHVQLALALPCMDSPGDGIALASLLDVTELKRLSSELDLSLGQLRRAHRELETFAYSVSHDLKAPLRGLDGYSQLLLDSYGNEIDADGRLCLQHIRTAARQMAQITDDLLAYARLERSEQRLGVVALDELVRTVLAGAEGSLRQHRAALVLQVPPLAAWADSKGLSMVLRNLVDNALKFSATVGEPALTIGAERRPAGTGAEAVGAATVRLWVRDNGVGFDMAFHDRIFQIFQRLHRAEEFAGTGVGLAMVAKAMERMGGRVWADSAPSQGATFWLELPAAACTLQAAGGPAEPQLSS